MKKTLTFLSISLLLVTSINAQRGKESSKKINALKIAYITEQLNLTSSEAEKFWPIYNDYNKKQNKARNNYRKALKTHLAEDKNLDNLNEEDAKKLIDLKLSTDLQLYKLQKKFAQDIKSIISYKKIIKLQVAEMEFGRKLMRKYKRDNKKTKE